MKHLKSGEKKKREESVLSRKGSSFCENDNSIYLGSKIMHLKAMLQAQEDDGDQILEEGVKIFILSTNI